MSEQILLAGYRGDVVLVNGLCYEFTGYTAQPPEDLDVVAKYDTCEECSEEGGLVPDAPGESSGSSSSIIVPTITCTYGEETCIHPEEYIVTLGGLAGTAWDWASAPTSLLGGNCQSWFVNYDVPPTFITGAFVLRWNPTYSKWYIDLIAPSYGFLMWESPGDDPCDPTGDWGMHITCIFNDDCDDLVTTCNVSTPPGF